MSAQDTITVAAAVVALTQLFKWSGVPDRFGPVVVLLLAAVGVTVWVYSAGGMPRGEAFEIFAGWISVATSASGVYGFTRAGAAALTRATPPPSSGAGSEPTL